MAVVTAKDRLIAGIMELTEEQLLEALPSDLLAEWLDVLVVFDYCRKHDCTVDEDRG
jgi:hypothetical protein